jgi:hypothetical protein
MSALELGFTVFSIPVPEQHGISLSFVRQRERTLSNFQVRTRQTIASFVQADARGAACDRWREFRKSGGQAHAGRAGIMGGRAARSRRLRQECQDAAASDAARDCMPR